jgi:crotonobetainyl-CoA:carnitine CoA-transferase CaiB-like acyl-CoA transferase
MAPSGCPEGKMSDRMTETSTAPYRRHSPLSRFTVIDVSRVRAGPNAVRQLSDWGARVIKVESPVEDDMTGARDGSDFQNLHRNKQSMTLDLKQPAGVAVLKRLVSKADVLVENFRPDVKHRLGIDYESLRAVNPRLVYGSISGFGQDGPYRTRAGFDTIAQGMGGLMSVTGEPGGAPLRAGIPVADLCSGLFCAIGILTALLDREVTGAGQWVQTSLLQAQVAMLDFQAARWLIDGVVPGQTGHHHPYMTPMGVFPTADGNMIIGASGQEQYKKFCDVMEAPDLLTDPRFSTVELRAQNLEAFVEAVARLTRQRPVAEWVMLFNRAGIASGPINAIDQVFEDPQVKHHGMVRPVQHPRLGEINVLGSPITLSDSTSAIERTSPDRGENTDEILTTLGFTPDEIAALRGERVVS